MSIIEPSILKDLFLDSQGRNHEDENYFLYAGDEDQVVCLKKQIKMYQYIYGLCMLNDDDMLLYIDNNINEIAFRLISVISCDYIEIMKNLSEDNPWNKRREMLTNEEGVK